MEKMHAQPSNTDSVVKRIELAARRVDIEGLCAAVYYDEGEDTAGVYVLFFKPTAVPNLVVTVRFGDDVTSMENGEITHRAERVIREMMAME